MLLIKVFFVVTACALLCVILTHIMHKTRRDDFIAAPAVLSIALSFANLFFSMGIVADNKIPGLDVEFEVFLFSLIALAVSLLMSGFAQAGNKKDDKGANKDNDQEEYSGVAILAFAYYFCAIMVFLPIMEIYQACQLGHST